MPAPSLKRFPRSGRSLDLSADPRRPGVGAGPRTCRLCAAHARPARAGRRANHVLRRGLRRPAWRTCPTFERSRTAGTRSGIIWHECWLQRYSPARLEEEIGEHMGRSAGHGSAAEWISGPRIQLVAPTAGGPGQVQVCYDASTLPTFLGPLARLYFLASAALTPEERAERSVCSARSATASGRTGRTNGGSRRAAAARDPGHHCAGDPYAVPHELPALSEPFSRR